MPKAIRHGEKLYRRVFRMRARKVSMSEIARQLGVARTTLDRWENGWKSRSGKRYPGWKERLQRAWETKVEADVEYGLVLREERLKVLSRIAQMEAVKLEEAMSKVEARSVADLKALSSEVRECLRLIGQELGQSRSGGSQQQVVVVRNEVTPEFLRTRMEQVMPINAGVDGEEGNGGTGSE